MLYLLGYFFTGLALTAGTVSLLTVLHRRSRFKPVNRITRKPPEFKSRAVITFSMVLPFAALSFLLLTFNGMTIAQSLHAEGHYAYVVEALLAPTICFLIGYFYFRRMVR